MTNRYMMIGLLALLLLIAGCAEEIKAPVDPVISGGTLTPVPDVFATGMSGVEAYYYVYLPDGYNDGGDPYPVVYMLHGFSGDENYFPAIFGLTTAVDELIAAGDLDPMVLVFPNGKNAFAGSFYTDGAHPYVGNAATHILDVITEVEDNYHVATDAAGKAICGASMGGYGSLNIALDNPGMFGYVGVNSAPVAFWGTKTLDPPTDDYKGIEELLPFILAETGFTPDPDWDPANPDPAVMEDYQTRMVPSEDKPLTSMMVAMAAAFSPTAVAGPTSHGALFVDLPIGLDGELYMDVWDLWLTRDILYRTVVQDLSNQAASFATFDLYMCVGLEDDLGLFGAHQVLETVLTEIGFAPEVSRYFASEAGIPAGHVEFTSPEFLLMLEWFDGKF